MNIHGVSDIRQTEIHTAEPLVPEPSAFEVKNVTENLKRHKLPGIDQIPAEFIKSEARTIHSEIHKLIISVWNKEELPEECNYSVILLIFLIHNKDNKTECSNYRDIPLLSTMYKMLSNILL